MYVHHYVLDRLPSANASLEGRFLGIARIRRPSLCLRGVQLQPLRYAQPKALLHVILAILINLAERSTRYHLQRTQYSFPVTPLGLHLEEVRLPAICTGPCRKL